MINIILSLRILCNYVNSQYKLPMHYLYIILHAGVIGLIIFLMPRCYGYQMFVIIFFTISFSIHLQIGILGVILSDIPT